MQRQPPAPVTASCIIPPEPTSPPCPAAPTASGGHGQQAGGLYHGSFRVVMNTDFLKKEGVTHIVNTAKGMEVFGPKYTVSVLCELAL